MSEINAPAFFCNGQPSSREAFYAIACNPERSVAVEACAGSGKTWMLVSRIVRALVQGTPANEILAITFSRKACAEMRQRLQDELARYAQADEPTLRQALRERGMPHPEPGHLATLRGLQAQLLQQGQAVQIRTFHSWFANLLQAAPLAFIQGMGWPVPYRVQEDEDLTQALLWRRFYQRLRQEPALETDFRDVVGTHGRHQTEKGLQALVRQRRVEFQRADAAGRLESSVAHFSDQFPALAALEQPAHWLRTPQAQALLGQAAAVLGRASAAGQRAAAQTLEQALACGDLPLVHATLFTQEGTPRVFNNKLPQIEQVREAQQVLQPVWQAEQQHQAWHYQQRMTRLGRCLLQIAAQIKREQGWIDMNDLEQGALRLMQDTSLSGRLQERLDQRTRQLLVDEFQDTNPSQWQTLLAWLSGYAGAGGAAPGVFIVGDPKQSIYRFRRAEPQVFEAAQAFVREGLQGDVLACDHTRRNAQQLVAAINQVMGEAAATEAYSGFRAHTSESAHTGGVWHLPPVTSPAASQAQPTPDPADPLDPPMRWRDSLNQPREPVQDPLLQQEARQAAHWVAQKIKAGVAPQDLMVLARKRSRLSVMQEALAALGIAAQQPENQDLYAAPGVQDLTALLDVLVSPHKNASLARALKSPLFGLADRDLVRLAQHQRQQGGSWWQALQALTGQAPVQPDDFEPSVESSPSPSPPDWAGIAARLQCYQDWVNQLPPHDALTHIYHHGDVLARYVAHSPELLRQAVQQQLRALLRAALDEAGGARYATPYRLVRALKAGVIKAPAPLHPAAVRLLTVHGAKGLEAPWVLLLDTDAAEPKADTMTMLVDWPGADLAPRRFAFLASESRPPECAKALLETQRQERAREELNALYVAMTRAQLGLVISSAQPLRGAAHSWWRRMQPLAQPLQSPVHAPQPVPASPYAPVPRLLELPRLPPALLSQWALQHECATTDTPAARIGQAMHRLLEYPRWPADESGPWAQEFRLTLEQARQALALAHAVRHGEAAWAWDTQALQWQGNEVELWYQGRMLRLDRLVQRRDSGDWWVLDYKTAANPAAQADELAQLHTYRCAVQAAHPGAAVHAAFITGHGVLQKLTGSLSPQAQSPTLKLELP